MAGRPADRMRNIGITRTNGKTTTTYLVEPILKASGQTPGVLGTVSYLFGWISGKQQTFSRRFESGVAKWIRDRSWRTCRWIAAGV